VHDGHNPFPGALESLAELKKLGKKTILLSNAPRRVDAIAARLLEMGIPNDAYGDLYSSGQRTFECLRDRPDKWYKNLGGKFAHIGPVRDSSLYEGLDLTRVANDNEAEFILNSGISDNSQNVADFEEDLQRFRARNLKMICANPDLVVMIQDKKIICAGAIAARYQELGGEVRYHGKPHAEIYEIVMQRLKVKNPSRILAIGDALATDVTGGKAAGCDTLWILSGIHGDEIGDIKNQFAINTYLAGQNVKPDFVQEELIWK
jgi:HAD superfamily hydrolase (TIGR01459 family)